MTREEAIRRLRYIRMDYLGYPPFLEPIDMAIEALSEVRCNDCKWNDDVIEVVRCKDCRWYEPMYTDKEYDCPQGLYAVYENDFCSHGERREP